MTRSIGRFSMLLAAVLVMLMVTTAVWAATTPKVRLKAASSNCKVGTSVKLTATVTGGTAYEVRIYKKVGSTWKKAVTATLVAPGKYIAYVKASANGIMRLKASFVDSSGRVRAWSNTVSVKVTS